MKSLGICAKRGKNHYGIYYGAGSDNIKTTEKYFDKYLPVVEKMIDSFEFI
jgi:hypothetical protein